MPETSRITDHPNPKHSQACANEKGYKKIAIITGTTGFGDQGRKQLKTFAPDYGLEIIADETYGPRDTDMTAQLMKIKEKGAEALVNWSIVPAQSIVAKNMHQLEMKIPLYQSHGFGNVRYLEACGEAGEGIIFPAGRLLAVDTLPKDHPQWKVLMEYKKKYEIILEELDNMYWYDKKVYEIIESGESISELSRKTNISYYSLYNTYKKVKKYLKDKI